MVESRYLPGRAGIYCGAVRLFFFSLLLLFVVASNERERLFPVLRPGPAAQGILIPGPHIGKTVPDPAIWPEKKSFPFLYFCPSKHGRRRSSFFCGDTSSLMCVSWLQSHSASSSYYDLCIAEQNWKVPPFADALKKFDPHRLAPMTFLENVDVSHGICHAAKKKLVSDRPKLNQQLQSITHSGTYTQTKVFFFFGSFCSHFYDIKFIGEKKKIIISTQHFIA